MMMMNIIITITTPQGGGLPAASRHRAAVSEASCGRQRGWPCSRTTDYDDDDDDGDDDDDE